MKRILLILFALLLVIQTFFCYITANNLQTNFSEPSFINKPNINSLNFAQMLCVPALSSTSNETYTITQGLESVPPSNLLLMMDIQNDNVWKITFCTICLVIIIVAVVVLLYKIHRSNKK